MKNKHFPAIAFAILVACSSCGNDGPSVPSTPSEPDKPNVQIPINIGTTISRATETGQRKSTGGVFYFIVFCIFAL